MCGVQGCSGMVSSFEVSGTYRTGQVQDSACLESSKEVTLLPKLEFNMYMYM